MNRITGIVDKADQEWAWVRTRRGVASGQCTHKHHVQMVEGTDRMVIQARNAAHAKAGDEVELYFRTRFKFKGLIVIYMFPVLGLMLGAFSAKPLSELLGLSVHTGLVFFTLGGLILAVRLMQFASRRMAEKGQLTPLISRVVRRPSRASAGFFAEVPGYGSHEMGAGSAIFSEYPTRKEQEK